MTRMIPVVLALILVALAPSIAGAQPAAPDWTLKVKLGKPVFVTMLNGEMWEGIAGQVTSDSVVVSTPAGVRTLPLAGIQKVQRRDALWTGAAIGAVAGAAFGIAEVQRVDCQPNEHPNDPDFCDGATPFTVTAAVMFGLIGWGIDALVKGRSTVFDRSRAPQVSLTLGPKAIGASARISW